MTSRAHSRHQQGHQNEAQRELARAQEDYQRLRQAYLELARGGHNEVALAMVGADMERANASLQSLRETPITPEEPIRTLKREARRLAEENA